MQIGGFTKLRKILQKYPEITMSKFYSSMEEVAHQQEEVETNICSIPLKDRLLVEFINYVERLKVAHYYFFFVREPRNLDNYSRLND